jgi:hypothetical protein
MCGCGTIRRLRNAFLAYQQMARACIELIIVVTLLLGWNSLCCDHVLYEINFTVAGTGAGPTEMGWTISAVVYNKNRQCNYA